MENEISAVSDRVINRIYKNEYGQISAEISQESADQLIVGLCQVAGQVPEKALNVVSQIYADALARQEELEIRTMNDDAEIMRRFNDQVDDAMKQLDLRDSRTVESFEKVCNILGKNLRDQLQQKHKPSLFDKIFKRR